MTNEEAVFCIFLMRFNLQPSEAMGIVIKWLQDHPAETWTTLKHLLKEEKIIVSQGQIKEAPQKATTKETQKAAKYRGVEIQKTNLATVDSNQNLKKKLRYRGQEYSN